MKWNVRKEQKAGYLDCEWNEFDFTFGYCNCIVIWKWKLDVFCLFEPKRKKLPLALEPQEEYQTFVIGFDFYVCVSHWIKKFINQIRTQWREKKLKWKMFINVYNAMLFVRVFASIWHVPKRGTDKRRVKNWQRKA